MVIFSFLGFSYKISVAVWEIPTVLSICLRTLILELNESTFNTFIFSVDIVKISFSRILVGLKLPVTEK